MNTTMTRTEQIKLIDKAFAALPDMARSFTEEKAVLYQMNLDAEAKYRKGAPYGMKHGLTKQQAARLFTVQHIGDALTDPRFTLGDILSIRLECLRAQALAERYGATIRAAWQQAGVKLADLKSVDYAALMQHGRD